MGESASLLAPTSANIMNIIHPKQCSLERYPSLAVSVVYHRSGRGHSVYRIVSTTVTRRLAVTTGPELMARRVRARGGERRYACVDEHSTTVTGASFSNWSVPNQSRRMPAHRISVRPAAHYPMPVGRRCSHNIVHHDRIAISMSSPHAACIDVSLYSQAHRRHARN